MSEQEEAKPNRAIRVMAWNKETFELECNKIVERVNYYQEGKTHQERNAAWEKFQHNVNTMEDGQTKLDRETHYVLRVDIEQVSRPDLLCHTLDNCEEIFSTFRQLWPEVSHICRRSGSTHVAMDMPIYAQGHTFVAHDFVLPGGNMAIPGAPETRQNPKELFKCLVATMNAFRMQKKLEHARAIKALEGEI